MALCQASPATLPLRLWDGLSGKANHSTGCLHRETVSAASLPGRDPPQHPRPSLLLYPLVCLWGWRTHCLSANSGTDPSLRGPSEDENALGEGQGWGRGPRRPEWEDKEGRRERTCTHPHPAGQPEVRPPAPRQGRRTNGGFVLGQRAARTTQ